MLREASYHLETSGDKVEEDDVTFKFLNVKGGLRAFSKDVDGQFPIY